MRIVVKQGGAIINELQFEKGPIRIGRHVESQIFLPDRAVSRHHAVIYNQQNNGWMVEDLDSTNKTYLNKKPIHKAKINPGDIIRIGEFTVELSLANETIADKAINLSDTLSQTATGLGSDTVSGTAMGTQFNGLDEAAPKVVIRKTDNTKAPNLVLPSKRANDFMIAAEIICKTTAIEELLVGLLRIVSKQLACYRVWCGLRSSPEGPMTVAAGRTAQGTTLQLDKIRLSDKIDEAIDKQRFLLFPRIPPSRDKVKINSAMIAPLKSQNGVFGAIYVDNDPSHERYTLRDLDYLMLVAMHTAVVVENF